MWHVVDLPANGQISNVSAIVLPEAWPVTDDERQVPMFPNHDPAREILVEVIKAQAEGIRLMAAVHQVLLEQGKRKMDKQRNGTIGSLRGSTAPEAPRSERLYQPQDKELRTWDGFRQRMQALEKVVRSERRLPSDVEVTRDNIHGAGGPQPKTLWRIMTLRYGMSADQWPPSTWPDEQPGGQS